jgi:quercetin dioxygenase-like cupin family protein
MALPHARPGQVIDLFPTHIAAGISVSHALFKSEQLELIQLVLPAGKGLPVHSVPGEITVQCLKGRIDFAINGRSRVIRAGQLLHVEGGVPHSLLAIEDASALLTIVFTRP